MHPLTQFFASPEDKDPNFVRLARNILVFTLIATVLSAAAVVITANSRALILTVSVLGVAGLLELAALVLALRGRLALAKIVVPAVLLMAVTLIAAGTNTIHDVSVMAYPVIIIIAILLQGRRALAVTTPLAVAAIIFLGILDMTGNSRSPLSSRTGLDDIIAAVVLVLVSAGILNLVIGRLRTALATTEANQQAVLETNRELKALQATLEQRVEQRTDELTQRGVELESANRQIQRRAAQLEAVARVMKAITSVRDLGELLPQIAMVISEKFGFYHVGVFLVDEANEYAILSAANSAGGQKMLARKHRLRVGAEGIVGFVTATGEPRVAMDVGSDPVFFDNPDLPETHSEMALPLRVEKQIVGALDTETGAFTAEDVQMLSLLADQVSLAIETARLFDETRVALAEAEAVSRQFTREAWSRLPVEHNLIGYRYSIAGASPLPEPVELLEKAQGRQAGAGQVAVPIELRGETIGMLVIQSPSGEELNQDQLDLIRAVAERVALSAENARLTGKIRSSTDPQAMVQTAIDELRKALGATRVEVIPQAIRDGR
jgi:GAF domain-containing protein